MSIVYTVGFRHDGVWHVNGTTMKQDEARERMKAFNTRDRAMYAVNGAVRGGGTGERLMRDISAVIETAKEDEGDTVLSVRRSSSEQMEFVIFVDGHQVAKVTLWSQDAADAIVGVAPARYRP